MKKILTLLSFAAIVACKEEPKDYVTLSGKIDNQNSDSLVVSSRTFSKTIKVNADGTFSDTLKVEPGIYRLFDGGEYATLHLKNGDDIKMTLDTKKFDESIKFTGAGSETSNFLAEKAMLQEKLFTMELFEIEKEEDFTKRIGEIKNELTAFLDKNSGIDSTIMANERKGLEQMQAGITKSYQAMKARKQQFASFIGKPAPAFNDFENHKGGTTSLKDLKGKYVYVDVWATWCGPCKREIPFLKEVEKEFHDKNIEFVSLSVDDGRGFKGDKNAAKEGWKKMVTDKELGGVQILSSDGWNIDFVKELQINGIPRFVLIDPAGNIVDADAPRPSSPKLKDLFNSLKI